MMDIDIPEVVAEAVNGEVESKPNITSSAAHGMKCMAPSGLNAHPHTAPVSPQTIRSSSSAADVD